MLYKYFNGYKVCYVNICPCGTSNFLLPQNMEYGGYFDKKFFEYYEDLFFQFFKVSLKLINSNQFYSTDLLQKFINKENFKVILI